MKQRMITALGIIAVTLPVLIFGGLPFTILGIALALLATKEMIEVRETVSKAPLEIKLLTMIATLLIVFRPFDLELVLIFVTLMLLLLGVVVRKSFTLQDASYYLLTALYIGSTFYALYQIRGLRLELLIFVILVVALTDSGAYFTGRKFGKRKLAPLISPKKTIEGSIGGTLTGVLTGLIYGLLTNLFASVLLLIMAGFIVSLVGQMGDLVASSIKREYKIKDFGTIFPGHGGILDRLDSLLFAALALYLALNLLNVVII